MALLLHAVLLGLIGILLSTNIEGYNETQRSTGQPFIERCRRRPRLEQKIDFEPFMKPYKIQDQIIVKWNKTVPYELENEMHKDLRKAITNAIETWNTLFKNCIEFTERKDEEDYVMFFQGPNCFSDIGKRSGKQFIVLHNGDCTSIGRIGHEMMHTIGFLHEHVRPDRDDYIKVLFEYIPPDWLRDYQKLEDFFFDELRGTPYDYYSVMHYPILGPDKYTPAIEVLDKDIDTSKVGTQVNFTESDIMKVRRLYCDDKQ